MSSKVPVEVMCFDLENSLAKALGKRVETFLVDIKTGLFKFRIGSRWNLVLDTDQLEDLWHDTDTLSVLKEKFDSYKADCLGFQDYKR